MVTTSRSVLAVYGGLAYAGALFVHMGSIALSEMNQVLSSGTLLAASAKLFVGTGVFVAIAAACGFFITLRAPSTPAPQCLQRLKVLAAMLGLSVVLLGTCAVLSVIMHKQAKSWTSDLSNWDYPDSRANYVASLGQVVCPVVMGYFCHTRPLTNPKTSYATQRYLLTTMLKGNQLVRVSDREWTLDINDTVATAVTMPQGGGRFIDLCSNVSARMDALGPAKELALELESACNVCRAVQPVSSLPPWMVTSSSSNPEVYFVTGPTCVACMQVHYRAHVTHATSPKDMWFVSSSSSTFDRYFLPEAFMRTWAPYSLAVAVGGVASALTSVALFIGAWQSVYKAEPGVEPSTY